VPELCDVKIEERVEDPLFQTQVEATGLACAEAGMGYRVLSEPDRQLLVNVRWLAGFRERPVDPDGERARMLSELATGSCTIGELLSGAREPMMARPVLMHLLWTARQRLICRRRSAREAACAGGCGWWRDRAEVAVGDRGAAGDRRRDDHCSLG
jgi:hypothetical protein